jgi:hypothetical protein
MLKAILMIPIALAAMFATPADATVVYNWRTLSVERGVEMSGRIGFSDEAWLARRAEVDFLGFAQSPIGSPGEYPRLALVQRGRDKRVGRWWDGSVERLPLASRSLVSARHAEQTP